MFHRRFAPILLLTLALAAGAITGCGGSDERPPAKNTTTLETGGVQVNAIVRPPAQSVTGTDEIITVLFLHGQSYTSRIWDDRQIMDPVVQAGFRAVAVDLPGYGDTPERPDDDGAEPEDNATWLRGLIDKLGGPTRVVVVSPSMSGSYSLPYLEEYPKDQLLGFVPVAPVGIDDFERPDDAAPIPAMAIWGSEDPSYTKDRAAHLVAQMRAPDGEAQTKVIPGAGHACYDDKPEQFTDLLLTFLGSLDKREP